MPVKNKGNPRTLKWNAIKKVYEMLGKYKQIVVVSIENVGSFQVQQIRKTIGEQGGILVIGKNTVIRKAANLRANKLPVVAADHENFENYKELAKLGQPIPELSEFLPLIKQKVGFIFTNEPVQSLRPRVEANKVAAPARAGFPAPIDFTIPAGPTGMDPSQITFFHALQIATKINKGQIEIQKDVQVCFEGKKVANSQVALLQKMNMKPFSYGMLVTGCYDDGTVLGMDVIKMSQTEIISSFQNGVRNLTALSLATGIPTELSVPHSILDAFKNLAAIGLTIGHQFKQLSGAQSGASSSSTAAKSAPKDAPKQAAKKEEPKKEEPPAEEEADVGMGGLFDD